MTGLELRIWASTLGDDADIEVKNYSWEKLKSDSIRAISTPKRTMDSVCNLEDSHD